MDGSILDFKQENVLRNEREIHGMSILHVKAE